MIILAGLAVDLGGQVYAKQRAQDIAAQAARAGGQQLDPAAAVRGQGVTLDPAKAVAAINAYLAGSPEVSGTATVSGPDTITVTTASTYQTSFLSIIGINSLQVSGHAQAHITRVVEGVAR